jgi:cysteinyl-tRNA synthetase
MELKLYNSLTKKIEALKPIVDGQVSIYSCGPTVYDYAHIGNFRAFLFTDLLQRVIRNTLGLELKWVMNITDIDDKTIRDSKLGSPAWKNDFGEQTYDTKENLSKLTLYYENEFIKDLKSLRFDLNDYYKMPKATNYVKEMQDLVINIIQNGYGYIVAGSVYFNVKKWNIDDKYGKLKKLDFENMISSERLDDDENEKGQAADFVLWKAKKEGEPFWDFIINGENLPGRPGWHLECSAMGQAILGLPFDIHTGGIDLKFPHHEDEIAQSKAGYGVEPANFWCHNEFLEVEGQKMSKSLGNFYTLRDLINKGISPVQVRFSMLSSHYNSKYNFTFDDLASNGKAQARLQEFVYSLYEKSDGNQYFDTSKLKEQFDNELLNDLHSPKALAVLFKAVNSIEVSELKDESKSSLLDFMKYFNSIFNILNIEPRPEILIPAEVIAIAEKRLIAKQNKDWSQADDLRNEIISLGYTLKDTKEGYSIEPDIGK